MGTSEGKIYIINDYKHIIEPGVTFKVFINTIKLIKVKDEPFFIVVGENELFQIFDISFKVVFTGKIWKDVGSKNNK